MLTVQGVVLRDSRPKAWRCQNVVAPVTPRGISARGSLSVWSVDFAPFTPFKAFSQTLSHLWRWRRSRCRSASLCFLSFRALKSASSASCASFDSVWSVRWSLAFGIRSSAFSSDARLLWGSGGSIALAMISLRSSALILHVCRGWIGLLFQMSLRSSLWTEGYMCTVSPFYSAVRQFVMLLMWAVVLTDGATSLSGYITCDGVRGPSFLQARWAAHSKHKELQRKNTCAVWNGSIPTAKSAKPDSCSCHFVSVPSDWGACSNLPPVVRRNLPSKWGRNDALHDLCLGHLVSFVSSILHTQEALKAWKSVKTCFPCIHLVEACCWMRTARPNPRQTTFSVQLYAFAEQVVSCRSLCEHTSHLHNQLGLKAKIKLLLRLRNGQNILCLVAR